MTMLQLSGYLLYAAFIGYLIATLLFGGAIKKSPVKQQANQWEKLAVSVTVLAFIANIGYFICRWIAVKHAPVSNMFEFTAAFGMFIVGAFLVIYFMYRVPALGIVALPIAILVIGYAAMFDREVSPLVPSLQSHWLTIHVICAAIGESILAISAVAGLVYLLKNVDTTKRSKSSFWLESVMYSVMIVIGFVLASVTFSVIGYESSFDYVDKEGRDAEITYTMPAIWGMNEYVPQQEDTFTPLAETPPVINAKKLTTVTWAILFGTVLYGLIRVIARRRISTMLQPLFKRVNSDLMDEIGYRAVLIGYPIFVLGALVFAMIWAHEAWGRYWGWDPKEVWALITALFYTVFLHLRLSKGWEGEKSAWLAVIGFIIIMFNLVAVNLIIAGLHSYAS
ncbi:c-type cytochrome biogenesis protein CcsB [Caryophanon tenue]|uniref:C-type cytochrome biogenesis protein CcsB n=1 Tax=Caryophanon tenue TaxID=33978 RepID=A0A1C0YKS1_9BACL|nr:c-type cytochrome biogenesis protein CcsB [Caryophanon tenue]OCS87785.1 c-type cytochrome biogenesis protein CcsB [Caryophanon tenue]